MWCHFDHLIYKHPGAARVAWHQDLASSKTGLLERAVHFWIPLHDLTPESGCMMFAPGCPSRELLRHVPQHEVGGTAIRIDPGKGEFEFVTKTLPMGGFSVHSPRTVHASAANQGDDLRKAWILQFGVGSGPLGLAATRRASAPWLRRRLILAQLGSRAKQ